MKAQRTQRSIASNILKPPFGACTLHGMLVEVWRAISTGTVQLDYATIQPFYSNRLLFALCPFGCRYVPDTLRILLLARARRASQKYRAIS